MIRIHIKFLFPNAHNKPTVFFAKKNLCDHVSHIVSKRLIDLAEWTPSLPCQPKKIAGEKPGFDWLWQHDLGSKTHQVMTLGFVEGHVLHVQWCFWGMTNYPIIFKGFFQIKPWKFQWNQDPILTNIFQMGWNHQLVFVGSSDSQKPSDESAAKHCWLQLVVKGVKRPKPPAF